MTPQQPPEQEKQKPRVSVVAVSHNRKEQLRRCLTALEQSDGRDSLQIIVVDNGSTDGSAQLDAEFPKVQFIRLPKNFGLTKALNLGWRAADADYVLFLHDDTEIAPNAIGLLAGALDGDAQVAAVCPLLVDGEGRPGPQVGNIPPDGTWRPVAVAGTDPMEVEYPRGAALMMRVFHLRSIRQIDERYGQFGADADLAVQIRRSSKKILLIPEAKVRHEGREEYTARERADLLLARSVFLGKYEGSGAGVKARIAAVLGPLLGFRLGEARYTAAGQKIDGTQS